MKATKNLAATNRFAKSDQAAPVVSAAKSEATRETEWAGSPDSFAEIVFAFEFVFVGADVKFALKLVALSWVALSSVAGRAQVTMRR